MKLTIAAMKKKMKKYNKNIFYQNNKRNEKKFSSNNLFSLKIWKIYTIF